MDGLAGSARYSVATCDARAAEGLVRELGVTPLVARVLVARGFADVTEARRFLTPSLERDWEPPCDIPGMDEATERVRAALAAGERIAVFGDFDVDGMSATSLLTLALRRLGGDVAPFIPHRFAEGYGLSREALARMVDVADPSLVVTVDNGIAAGAEVAWLREQGLDVVVTDHHEPGESVPTGVPVCNPKLADGGASRELAGAGVALKMVCELGRRLGQDELWRDYTDLAMLGTISDMMPLTPENRALVADGIARLRRGTRVGLVALASRAGVELSEIASDTLPFSLVPRLNAAGRMGTTDVATELLLTDDPLRAAELADALERTNAERREIEAQLAEAALAQADETYDGGRAVVVAGAGWHEGVKGIVASRLVGRYGVPAIVFTIEGDVARGSGRSVGSVDLFHAVEQCCDLLVRFGGHEGAVGVTCEVARLDEFRARLSAVLAELPAERFESRSVISAVCRLDELDEAGIDALDALAPFGQGNRKPLLAALGVGMRYRSRVGVAANHLRFTATDGRTSVPAIMFRTPEIERAVDCDEMVDLVFEAVNETWQGRTRPKLMVRDICYRDEGEPGAPALVEELFSQPGEGGAGAAPGQAPDAGAASAPRAPEVPGGELSRLDDDALTAELRRRLVGDHEFLATQREALARLAAGRSTLAVMATGRGKSLIFHLHAARLAIAEGKASVFVYPLRALVSDQAFHLVETLGELGVTATVLTGETPADERARRYGELASGAVDIVLTTPEYLAIHVGELAASGRVGFLVVDEAHHAGSARGGQRSAYLELARVRAALGDPVALACTATATGEQAREICRLLSIDEADVLVDRSVRPNLSVNDMRGTRERELALSSIVATGEKTVVYLNSRMGTVALARTLRRAVPSLGERIAFYNAGLERDVRGRIERAFRDGLLSCVVSTSAFGEGVNVADIRNVVLYQLPFGRTAFNQMSGRAGRDGDPASIHLLFGADDAAADERILAVTAPAAEELRGLYRGLRALGRRDGAAGGQGFSVVDERVRRELSAALGMAEPLRQAAVDAALGIFEELGLAAVTGFGDARRAVMTQDPPRVELESSVRYTEGLRTIETFAAFRDWALAAPPEELLAGINRPVVPDFGRVVDGEEG